MGQVKYAVCREIVPCPLCVGKSLSLNQKCYLAMDIMVTNLDYIIQETRGQQKFLSNHFRISSCHLNLVCILRGRFLNENFHFIVLVNTCFVIYLQFTLFFSCFITLARKVLEIFCSLWAISFFSTSANFLERNPQDKACTFYVICYFQNIKCQKLIHSSFKGAQHFRYKLFIKCGKLS